MNSIRVLAIASALVLAAGCTKPVPAETATTPAPAATTEAPATAPVMLFNAYTSNALTPEGIPGEPAKVFKTSDKIYVGAVVHGEAASSTIKVEWTAEGASAPSSDETSMPVKSASVAAVDLTKAAPLAPGKYNVLVYLDGVPGWELAFDVQE